MAKWLKHREKEADLFSKFQSGDIDRGYEMWVPAEKERYVNCITIYKNKDTPSTYHIAVQAANPYSKGSFEVLKNEINNVSGGNFTNVKVKYEQEASVIHFKGNTDSVDDSVFLLETLAKVEEIENDKLNEMKQYIGLPAKLSDKELLKLILENKSYKKALEVANSYGVIERQNIIMRLAEGCIQNNLGQLAYELYTEIPTISPHYKKAQDAIANILYLQPYDDENERVQDLTLALHSALQAENIILFNKILKEISGRSRMAPADINADSVSLMVELAQDLKIADQKNVKQSEMLEQQNAEIKQLKEQLKDTQDELQKIKQSKEQPVLGFFAKKDPKEGKTQHFSLRNSC